MLRRSNTLNFVFFRTKLTCFFFGLTWKDRIILRIWKLISRKNHRECHQLGKNMYVIITYDHLPINRIICAIQLNGEGYMDFSIHSWIHRAYNNICRKLDEISDIKQLECVLDSYNAQVGNQTRLGVRGGKSTFWFCRFFFQAGMSQKKSKCGDGTGPGRGLLTWERLKNLTFASYITTNIEA